MQVFSGEASTVGKIRIVIGTNTGGLTNGFGGRQAPEGLTHSMLCHTAGKILIARSCSKAFSIKLSIDGIQLWDQDQGSGSCKTVKQFAVSQAA